MRDVKAILREYQPALRYAQRCFKELDEAKDVWIRSPRLDGMPRAGGGGLEKQVERMDALEKRAEAARQKALDLLAQVEELEGKLGGFDRKAVIRLRYIEGMTWAQVAQTMSWSERTVRRIHGAALQELRRKEILP